ncbi:unnamed protein product [Rhizoctonia solani]|uniref:Uncharacterized protein n=1 Tax=Rhizoctonia solani TaxID=456999 RepID=A0A8H3CYP3_9AGAM|nr:unnamed protein product [Rhizoctonia solani]
MYSAMFSSGASGSYVPSEAGSFATTFHTPPQSPRKAPKMVVEVVIPVRKTAKTRSSLPVDGTTEPTGPGSRRRRVRETSPARSDSSISLGTYWYMSPKKKRRTLKRKRPSTTVEAEQLKPERRFKRRGRQRKVPSHGQEGHIGTTKPGPAPPLAEPIAHDLQPRPGSPSTPASKPRAHLPWSAPGMRINLESARLETIQAQESARGYDIYHHWPTPPASGSTKTRVVNGLNTPSTPSYPEPRMQLYASSKVGSSTGPGTREHDRILGEHDRTLGARVPTSGVPSEALKSFAPHTPLTIDRSRPTFARPLEEELGTVGPEVNKLARLGLQTALRELAERYDFPLENISKLYRSKGNLEETEVVLSELRLMTNAVFGNGSE